MPTSKPDRYTVPSNATERITSRIIRPLGVILVLLLVVYGWAVYNAPIDRVQGVIQKILYVHPPLAYGAYLGFAVTGIAGGLYLWRREEAWDRLAIAGAEVGVLFCTLMIVTGPIWAKGTWGRYWSWDPRLTVTLLLWFVYLAYMLLRSFSAGGERTARFAAVYGILGIVLIPLNYYIIEIFSGRSMHPENLERGSLGAGMGFPFLMGNLTLFIAFVYLLLLRWQVEALRADEAQRIHQRVGAEGD
ncbi:MAG: cytochrome c biogenesis protein [Myxococcota bacterium]|nr:cytochrome c biogenesis protein [Myxococcota bacterium]